MAWQIHNEVFCFDRINTGTQQLVPGVKCLRLKRTDTEKWNVLPVHIEKRKQGEREN